ncbi:hypothetical protein ACOI1D_19445, partial [Virgibacillus sp. DJP39]
NNGHIKIEKGTDGGPAHVSIEQVISDVPTIAIDFNGKSIAINPIFHVNDHKVTKDYTLKDNDVLVITQVKTIQDFLTARSSEKLQMMQPFVVYLNKQRFEIKSAESQLILNGETATLNYKLKNGDSLTIRSAGTPTVSDLINQTEKKMTESIKIIFNESAIHLQQDLIRVSRNNLQLSETTKLNPGDHLEVKEQTTKAFIFQDVFKYVDIDMAKVTTNFQLYKNNQVTSFDEQIKDGDTLKISF